MTRDGYITPNEHTERFTGVGDLTLSPGHPEGGRSGSFFTTVSAQRAESSPRGAEQGGIGPPKGGTLKGPKQRKVGNNECHDTTEMEPFTNM